MPLRCAACCNLCALATSDPPPNAHTCAPAQQRTGEFCKTAGPKPEWVTQSVAELEVHSRLLDEMGMLPATTHNKVRAALCWGLLAGPVVAWELGCFSLHSACFIRLQAPKATTNTQHHQHHQHTTPPTPPTIPTTTTQDQHPCGGHLWGGQGGHDAPLRPRGQHAPLRKLQGAADGGERRQGLPVQVGVRSPALELGG